MLYRLFHFETFMLIIVFSKSPSLTASMLISSFVCKKLSPFSKTSSLKLKHFLSSSFSSVFLKLKTSKIDLASIIFYP
ncbi:hypothetical protein CJE1437 [Campylobacter jejuni RM1221]|nr:hypothetical protein CJE1437 [Campylobacter jejuni RM1221]AHN82934.1 hypothetical protein 00-2425CJIE4_1 [Campylobacter phage CJIE4-3]AHN82992.1 hypothetical protein 00-6200CJIE4_1 [Campylobacter phage CJIE4-4]